MFGVDDASSNPDSSAEEEGAKGPPSRALQEDAKRPGVEASAQPPLSSHVPTEAGGLSGHYAQSDAERERVEKEIVKAEDKRNKAEAEKAAAAQKQLDSAKRAAFLSGRRHGGAIPAEVGAEARAKRAASVQGHRDTPSPKNKM